MLSANCSTPRNALVPNGAAVGVAPFAQPLNTVDLLAGNLPEDQIRLDPVLLTRLDSDFELMLREFSPMVFLEREQSLRCAREYPGAKNAGAFNRWLRVGQCLEADMLILPHMLQRREEKDGAPPLVIMDIFLLDIKNQSLLARSRLDAQRCLAAGERGPLEQYTKKLQPDALDALELEGMFKAIMEFGL
jgi:hypothetical protein